MNMLEKLIQAKITATESKQVAESDKEKVILLSASLQDASGSWKFTIAGREEFPRIEAWQPAVNHEIEKSHNTGRKEFSNARGYRIRHTPVICYVVNKNVEIVEVGCYKDNWEEAQEIIQDWVGSVSYE